VNRLAGGNQCSLLDVGCGPAALRGLLDRNICYYGVDLAIHNRADYLLEADIVQGKVSFDNKRFDFVVAMGFFEYAGQRQNEKFEEIKDILEDDGKFIMSYVNFGHYRRRIWPNYNNVQSIAELQQALGRVFTVERCFPASHHWRQKQPGRNSLRGIQMHINFNLPIISPKLAVEYLFVCSRKG
jgi:SAM-dependent methyltransferase